MRANDPSSAKSARHGVPFLVAIVAHVVLGYLLYFLAAGAPEQVHWAAVLIDRFKHDVRALQTVARLSDHPLPTQLLLLYAVAAWIVLSVWFAYCTFGIAWIRGEFHRRSAGLLTRRGRTKVLAAGLFCVVVSLAVFPLLLFVHDPSGGSWQTVVFFSPSPASAFVLLLASCVAAWGLSVGMWQIYLVATGLKLDSMRS